MKQEFRTAFTSSASKDQSDFSASTPETYAIFIPEEIVYSPRLPAR